MWVVVAILLLLLGLRWKREGFTGTPAEAAEAQKGDLRFIEKKIENLVDVMSPDELDRQQIKLTELESKVSDLGAKVKEFFETKKINDSMGYPNDPMPTKKDRAD